MNHLAHALLSGDDSDILLGGMLGDFVHGPSRDDAPWAERVREWRRGRTQLVVQVVKGNHDRHFDARALGIDVVGEPSIERPFAFAHHPGATPGALRTDLHLDGPASAAKPRRKLVVLTNGDFNAALNLTMSSYLKAWSKRHGAQAVMVNGSTLAAWSERFLLDEHVLPPENKVLLRRSIRTLSTCLRWKAIHPEHLLILLSTIF